MSTLRVLGVLPEYREPSGRRRRGVFIVLADYELAQHPGLP